MIAKFGSGPGLSQRRIASIVKRLRRDIAGCLNDTVGLTRCRDCDDKRICIKVLVEQLMVIQALDDVREERWQAAAETVQ